VASTHHQLFQVIRYKFDFQIFTVISILRGDFALQSEGGLDRSLARQLFRVFVVLILFLIVRILCRSKFFSFKI